MTDRYGGPHRALRRAALPYAWGQPCSRCGQPLVRGQKVDLDHTDDRTGYLGFAHQSCNRSAGAQKREALRAQHERNSDLLTTLVLALEVSQDNRNTTIVGAGAGKEKDHTHVAVLKYLSGVDHVVEEVEKLRDQRNVLGVAVHPRSPSAVLLRPLADAGVAVTLLSTTDENAATTLFDIEYREGRLQYARHPLLTAAAKFGIARPAGAGSYKVWDRRAETVDGSPIRAATWATWLWREKRSDDYDILDTVASCGDDDDDPSWRAWAG